MNKQELIKKYKRLEGVWDAEGAEIARRIFLLDLYQLDEPEAGHADEAPRYVKNILARLRELPLHDREVWLKAIMGQFEQDFSRAKWREGYEQGKFEGMIEREKVKIPQFAADYIEWTKEEDYHLLGAMGTIMTSRRKNLYEWFYDDDNIELFARAWLDGYEVEKEPKYKVKVKNTDDYLNETEVGFHFFNNSKKNKTFTRKELEYSDFAWVLNCPGIELVEVKE